MNDQKDIIFEVDKGVGWIKFNRPDKLNALSNKMILTLYNQLLKWKEDKGVEIICLEGSGEKAFCAGGDVRHLYDNKDNNIEEYAFDFFFTEYCMDTTMHCYPKPILVYMNGITMGGGAGIAVTGSHRIVTERTKWSMPEMNIGLYPDVGGSYFLNNMPGYIGRYLALTSTMIKPEDVLYLGTADYYIKSNSWQELRQAISEKTWTEKTLGNELNKLLERFSENPEKASDISRLREKIDAHFAYDTMEEIVSSLKKAGKEGDEWANKTVENLLTKSPTSLKVTLEQLIQGKEKSLMDCFKMELEMSMSFMDSHDFYEGVRSVLVDKDRSPNWKPKTLEEVKKEDVAKYFTYNWKDGINPLIRFYEKSDFQDCKK